MPGWGSAIGWIFNAIPAREERIRNKIDKIEREMNELTKIDKDQKLYVRSIAKYERLANKLRKLESKLKNRG